jgi:hypothetical protein
MVRQLAMQANLLANSGANICLGNDKSLFVDVHNINPIPVGIATTPKDEMQITYCRWMGYLPMLQEDGSTHMQPWYVHPNAVGCMLSPESFMAALSDITSWYQEGFHDGLNPGILCFHNAVDVTVLNVTMQKQNGLYYGRTNVLSINHNPIWVHCIDGALVICVSTRLTSCDTQPPAPAPALIEDNKSSCGSLAYATTTTPGVADDGGDAPVKDSLPSGGFDAPPCAPMAWEASHSQRTCWHKRKPSDPAEILLSELWAACLGHCEKWQLESLPDHANGLPPKKSIFIHCSLFITKFRLDCASNLQIRQPENLDALVNGISGILGSYGHLPVTILIPTWQLTELYTRWNGSTVTCWWWMSSRDMHGCPYVHLRSHPLTRCLHFYGYSASQTVESYNVTKAVNLPKAQGGACMC